MRPTYGKRTNTLWHAILWTAALPILLPFARAQTELPEGKGKEVVETVCSQCHGLGLTTTSKFTRQEWESVVHDMIARGAPLFEEEFQLAVDYLTQHFSKREAAAGGSSADAAKPIPVNQATAKELETALEVTAQEAEAIVRYREQNGKFTKWEDLQKVPGLDAKKIEAKKALVSF